MCKTSGEGDVRAVVAPQQPSESVGDSARRSPQTSFTSDAGKSSSEGFDVGEGEVEEDAGSTHSESSASSTNQRSTNRHRRALKRDPPSKKRAKRAPPWQCPPTDANPKTRERLCPGMCTCEDSPEHVPGLQDHHPGLPQHPYEFDQPQRYGAVEQVAWTGFGPPR